MELFLSYLNRHIDGSEQRLRSRMKKSFDRISKACKLSAEPAYSKWLHNKLTIYYPEHAWIDESEATGWAIVHVPDFEFLVQLIAAAHFQSWFGKWLSAPKAVAHKDGSIDFEFE